MVTIQEWYERVNAAWPSNVPPMTDRIAITAAKRLFRWATGHRLKRAVVVTSGNRSTWGYGNELRVNPSAGWRTFVHHLSHWIDTLAWSQRGRKPHDRSHARFELRMVREVLKRGWLESPAPVEKPKPSLIEQRAAHAVAMHARAVRRLKLAETIETKWRARVKYYAKKVGPLDDR